MYVVWATHLATGGGDLAAQLAWAGFARRHPGSAYNLSWYGGAHTANYSVLAPPLMALLGVRTVSVVAGLAGTWAMAALFVRARAARPIWPALLGALTVWCDVASGRSTFALGTAAGLFALLCARHATRTSPATGTIPATGTSLATGVCPATDAGPATRARRTTRTAAAATALLSALSALTSPVAALFLLVAGAAFLLDRQWSRAALLGVPPFAVVGTITLLFPFQGEQPMAPGKLWLPVLVCAALCLAAPRAWRVVRYGSSVYAVGVVLTFLIASPIGTNVERLAGLAGPPVLLAALLARVANGAYGPGSSPVLRSVHRLGNLSRLGPHLTLAAAVAVNTGWLINKTDDDLSVSTTVPAWAAHTEGVVAALRGLRADRTRVEVVPARDHREADVLAPHISMARGWNRQLDVVRGRLFYEGTLTPAAYRAWLDRWAVGIVVLPHGRPDGPAEAEAALVRSGLPWLAQVWQDDGWTVYRVEDAVPLVSVPATVVRGSDAELVIRVPEAGPVTVRIAYSPWLRARGACVRRAGAWTELTVPAAGDYTLGSVYGLPRNSHCRRTP
ncbi:hypothetical protein [Streptomyces sp. NPDC088725]|uniref:hypothetical protein n=1 Tax=Streptomyces sp. NPDC088725 TaxID=3365873 RepID=UPI0037FEA93C